MLRLVKFDSSFLKSISVEPSCFIFFFSFTVYSLGAQRLIIQKTCSPDSRPDIGELCRRPKLFGAASDINTGRNIIGEALPGLVVFIAGSWRDATGLSRPLIIYVFIMEFLAAGVFLVTGAFWEIPTWPASIIESTIGGLSGGKQLLNLASICAISARSSANNRTFRLTFFAVSTVAGLCLASAISGYVLPILGYTYFFGCIMVMYLLAFLLALIFIKEEPSKLAKGGKWLNISNLGIVFKPKLNRAVVWLMIANCWLMYTSAVGEANVILIFLEKAYGFTVTQSGVFLSYLMTMNLINTLIVSPFLIKVLKWSDFTIGIIGIILSIIALLGVVLVPSVKFLYFFTAFDVMRYTVLTVQRSIITKCLPPDELGTYWSFVAIGEALMPMVTLPIYDSVFTRTLETFTGAHYFVSVSITLASFVNICLAKQLFKKPPDESNEETRTEAIPNRENHEVK